MLFGSSGIRTPFDQELLAIAFHVGAGMAQEASQVVIGRDTRRTGPLLCHAVMAGLLAAGANAYEVEIAPTPSVAYGTRYMDAGCMVTASHNPEEYNGLKLFNPDGSSFGLEQQEEMEERIKDPQWGSWEGQGERFTFNVLTPHMSAILDRVECSIPLRVVLDCGNGAGSVMTPTVLDQLGTKAILLNCNPWGRFSRPSEPLPENLPYLGEVVRKTGARCAIAHDGDADRMVAWDSRGSPISGDHLMVIFTSYLGAKRVVTTMDASMAIEEKAEVIRTPVGDAFVSEQLREWGDFGAEPSGTWIFPELSLCPDGIHAAALFCEIAAEWDIEQEIAAMPTFNMLRESIATPQHREIMDLLGAKSPTDGVRLSKEHGWILIRASGTEPKVRITVEGTNSHKAKELLDEGRQMVIQAKRDAGNK